MSEERRLEELLISELRDAINLLRGEVRAVERSVTDLRVQSEVGLTTMGGRFDTDKQVRLAERRIVIFIASVIGGLAGFVVDGLKFLLE